MNTTLGSEKKQLNFVIPTNLTIDEVLEKIHHFDKHFNLAGGPGGDPPQEIDDTSFKFAFPLGSMENVKVKAVFTGNVAEFHVVGNMRLMEKYCNDIYKQDPRTLFTKWFTTALKKHSGSLLDLGASEVPPYRNTSSQTKTLKAVTETNGLKLDEEGVPLPTQQD